MAFQEDHTIAKIFRGLSEIIEWTRISHYKKNL